MRDELSEFDDAGALDAGNQPAPQNPPATELAKPEADTKVPIFNLPEGVLPEKLDEAPPPAETKPEPVTPPAQTDSVQERIAELTRERNEERKRNDELMRAILRGEVPGRTQEPKVEPIEIEPETRAAVEQVVKETVKPLDPLLAEAEERKNVQECEGLMKGFSDLWPEVKAAFAEMPPEQQVRFDNQAGAIAIAHQIKARKDAAAAMPNRAHSETKPNQTTGPTQRPRLSSTDVWGMSDEQFEKFVRAQTGRGEADLNYVDPLVQ